MSAFFRVSMALLLLGKPAALLAQFSDMEVFTSLDEALLNPSHVVALSLASQALEEAPLGLGAFPHLLMCDLSENHLA